MINSTGNPKILPVWVKSRDFGFNLMKYWLKSSAFTWKVRLILSCLSLADRATWNPGMLFFGCLSIVFRMGRRLRNIKENLKIFVISKEGNCHFSFAALFDMIQLVRIFVRLCFRFRSERNPILW